MSTFSSDRGQGDTRLTDQERQLVARLLSDPTLFPLEFRTWLKNYIESAGITVTASQIQGGGRITTGLPPGLIIACATIENQAAYVAGWLKTLAEDSRAVVIAAAQAQRAVDLILGRRSEAQ